ncbi:MAG: efflux RND transporter periplasmic adaptor subunit [Planctomycetota bacterium]
MLKWLIGIVLVLVVLGGAGGVVAMQSGALERFRGGGEDKGVEVIVEAAELGKLTRTVSAPGSVEPRALVQISSQVSAEVLALPFREGDLVRRGDVVVRLDPQDLEARLNSAQAQLRAEEARLIGSEASLINARLEYQRWERLLETGDATATEVEAAEARYKQAESNKLALEAGIEQARAGIDQVDEDIANTVIESPMDGIITVLNAEVGETVIVGTTNNAGSVIMEIADLGEMILEAQIDETNIAPVREGQPATIYINAYPDREYRGNVRRIGLKRQVSASGTGIFEVEILLEEISEDDRLYSGMTASTDIAVEEFFDVVVCRARRCWRSGSTSCPRT